MDATDSKKPFKVKDVTRNIKKSVCASTLEEIRSKIAEKFEKNDEEATIHLDSDGTEIDDEEYFRTLDENTELIAVFPGEQWIDPTHHLTISTPRDGTTGDTTDAAAETARIQQIVGQLKNNLCNVSVLSDSDLDSLSNMDPNSLVDITGKDFMDQLKDSGRPLCAKRTAQDRINLLKLLRDGAIFCSERYPEEAEAIDMEISRQLNMDLTTATQKNVAEAMATSSSSSSASPTSTTTTTTTIKSAIETTLTQDTTATKTIMEEKQKQNLEITTTKTITTTTNLAAANAANNNTNNSNKIIGQKVGNGNGNNNDI